MGLFKKLFSKNKNTSFKQKMKANFIPRVWKMITKEKNHLEYLITNGADKEDIENSRKRLNHLTKRYDEYNNYVKNLI